jgi:hypothetical protein
VKAQRLREREAAEAERTRALEELRRHTGRLDGIAISDEARAALLELHARALSAAGGPVRHAAQASATLPDGSRVRLLVAPRPGTSTVVRSPSGILELHDLSLELA